MIRMFASCWHCGASVRNMFFSSFFRVTACIIFYTSLLLFNIFNILTFPPSSPAVSFRHSTSWCRGAPRWPRRDGAKWRSSFRQWLKFSYMGQRSQGTSARTSRPLTTSRCVCVSKHIKWAIYNKSKCNIVKTVVDLTQLDHAPWKNWGLRFISYLLEVSNILWVVQVECFMY